MGKVGRPKAWNPTKEQIKRVEELAGYGCTAEEIASTMGIARTTLYKDKALIPELADAIKTGEERARAFAKSQLFSGVREANMTAVIFYLKTRCGWTDREKSPGEKLLDKIAVQLFAKEDSKQAIKMLKGPTIDAETK